MAARIEKVVTSGTFSLDGGTWDVDNNIWLVGDDHEVLVIDAAHDASPIVDAVGDRRVVAIVCTHGHNDHINAAVEVAAAMKRASRCTRRTRCSGRRSTTTCVRTSTLREENGFDVAGTTLAVLHTPGHSPGGVTIYAPDLGAVFSGDTLFQGGPGATGRSHSDFPTIIESIRRHLLTLPGNTVVHTGHGADTTIGAEAPHLGEWIARGH